MEGRGMKLSIYTAAAFVAGVFAGGWVLRDRINQEAQEEIAEAKEYYQKRARQDFEDTVRAFVHKWEGEEAAEKLEFKNGQPLLGKLLKPEEERERAKDFVSKAEAQEVTVEAAQKLIEHNGYTSYNSMDKPRQPNGETTSTEGIRGPYIISQETFYDHGLEKQNQITYYAGNDVLVSAKGKVVPKEDRTVLIGLDTLSKFGEMSNEDNVVYVRNPNLGAGVDFEITLDEGDYDGVGA
jgi:hypothetical protein